MESCCAQTQFTARLSQWQVSYKVRCIQFCGPQHFSQQLAPLYVSGFCDYTSRAHIIVVAAFDLFEDVSKHLMSGNDESTILAGYIYVVALQACLQWSRVCHEKAAVRSSSGYLACMRTPI